MKVIFIGSDRNIFKEGSAARARMIEYGALFDELHLVVFTTRKFEILNPKSETNSKSKIQIGENVFAYPTRSWCRWLYPFDAYRISSSIIENCKLKIGNSRNDYVVSGQDPFEAGLAAFWVTRKTGLPAEASAQAGTKLHLQVHTDFLSPFFKRQSLLNVLRVRIAEKILPQADGIRVVSKRIKDSLLQTKNYKLKTNPTVLPIYVEKNSSANAAPYDFRRAHPDWTFVILSVGRLEPEKNFELAIQTLEIVCRKYPHTGLAVVGEGNAKNKLRMLADSLGLSKNVLFIDGWQKGLSAFYRGANIYLQTSNYEGFGLAAVEAAYTGLPAVMTDVGAAGWLFRAGENSKICPVGDEKCLAASVINLIEDNGLRGRLRNSLLADFGKELPQTKAEYLEKYKESIEGCLKNPG
jgi:glycosyltransferase involved in cell wall biosynthesis